MPQPLRLRVCEVAQYVRNVHTRMPFRYGAATLTAVPVLHLRTTVETSDGRRAEGWSADCLPPGWFDKRPGRTFRDDVESLQAIVAEAIQRYLAAGEDTSFGLWYGVHQDLWPAATAAGETGLTASFGPALVERSVIDAVGKLAGSDLSTTFRSGLLGTDLAAIHPALAGQTVAQHVAAQPLGSVFVRHTVGLADPLTAADVPPGEELADGLPQTLEDYLLQRGLHYVKVKVTGNLDTDLARLTTIATLLDRHAPDYTVTLDGNEQFRYPAEAAAFLLQLGATPELQRFFRRIEYVEQPLARSTALDPEYAAGMEELAAIVPVIIDESDDSLDSLRQAIDLGYQGISIKNCKGVTKSVANGCLLHHAYRDAGGARPFFLTAEDLFNTTVVPVQQDLASVAMLHVPHVERNGHHYVRGLSHLSPAEAAQCLAVHGSLYEPLDGAGGQLKIRHGELDLESLRVAGFGVGFAPEWGFLTPLDEWRYESLGVA